jgi:hypothetical protein
MQVLMAVMAMAHFSSLRRSSDDPPPVFVWETMDARQIMEKTIKASHDGNRMAVLYSVFKLNVVTVIVFSFDVVDE